MTFILRILLADDEYGEKTVSVSLDGQEAELNFIDHPSNEMGVSGDIFIRHLYDSRYVAPGGEHHLHVRAPGLHGGLLHHRQGELRQGRGNVAVPRDSEERIRHQTGQNISTFLLYKRLQRLI